MSTIKIDQVEELTSIKSLSYIRPLEIKLTGSLLKPSTRYNLFFDGEKVNYIVKQDGKNTGDPLISDANGVLFATLYVPGFRFTSGEKSIVLTQEDTIAIQAGSNVSRADATFVSYSNDDFYTVNITGNVTTVDEVLTRNIVIPVTRQVALDDAIAQSFFTYGVDGGIFVTSIELYFQSKDNFLPVWVEIREMVNGFPGKHYISPFSIAYKNAADVTVSSTAASATKFTFPKLVYLPQDKEYCFVVRSRSNNYNLWSSRIGERSKETTRVVTEQPYTGSLFKTDNNITWSAEQFEDIKFVLNRANFNTSVQAVAKLPITSSAVVADGTRLHTMIESNVVLLNFPHKHGLDNNSVVHLSCDSLGVYNGVAGSVMSGTFNVFKIVNDYVAAFNVTGATFTKTGQIETGGRIRNITVTNQGSGYSSTSLPTVTISAPNVTGVQATAVAVVDSGKVVRIDITNPGRGYTGTPTVTITSATGSGATATAQNNAMVGVSTNRVFHDFSPTIVKTKPNYTNISATLETTLGRFESGTTSNYTENTTVYPINIDSLNTLDNNLLLASRFNEVENLGNQPSCLLSLNLASTKNNVSPVIDLNTSNFVLYGNTVSDLLPNEDILSTNSSGSIDTITITNGGSGYTTAPLITIVGGSNAKATAVLSGGVVTAINIVNPGIYFFEEPKLIFTEGGTPTVKAAATATITKFNSELLPNNGAGATKYVTKPQIIDTLSNSIRIYVTAYSNKNSSFEVYFKGSLSSSNVPHEENEWKLLSCNVTRNKSENRDQEFEYEFYSDNLSSFDVYSIKIVIRSLTPWDPPYISNYRAIILS